VRLVLWDVDGTLVHTAGYGRDAFGEAFAVIFGRQADLTSVSMGGRTDHDIAIEVLATAGVDDGDTHVPRMLDELAVALEAVRERIAEEGHPTPGARETLEALAHQSGITQSLLTGNIETNAALKLGAFGLARFVDLEIGGYGSDPHTTRSDLVGVAREKAQRLRGMRVDAADTILIGDTPLDVEAAHGAGARAIGVGAASFTRQQLLGAGAEAAFDDLRDTRGLLEALSTAST
jgi:phosphoglycolate phosphatase-like HAD superfamily hydrolase